MQDFGMSFVSHVCLGGIDCVKGFPFLVTPKAQVTASNFLAKISQKPCGEKKNKGGVKKNKGGVKKIKGGVKKNKGGVKKNKGGVKTTDGSPVVQIGIWENYKIIKSNVNLRLNRCSKEKEPR